jgi:hypothetical protein
MVAAQHREMPLCMRELSLFNVLHPGAVDAKRHLVFFLAHHTACMTPDTLAVVDEKAKFHAQLLFVLSSEP